MFGIIEDKKGLIQNETICSRTAVNVAVCLPTFKSFNRLYYKFLPTYNAIFSQKETSYKYTLCINLQGYSDQEESLIKRVLPADSKIAFRRPYPVPVSMSQIRLDTCDLFPDTDFFLNVDDDFVFNTKSQVIKFLKTIEGCVYRLKQ